MCVCVLFFYICLCRYVYMHRSDLDIRGSPSLCILFFWGRPSQWTWSSLIWLESLTCRSHKLSCLCLSSAGVASTCCYQAWCFKMVLEMELRSSSLCAEPLAHWSITTDCAVFACLKFWSWPGEMAPWWHILCGPSRTGILSLASHGGSQPPVILLPYDLMPLWASAHTWCI